MTSRSGPDRCPGALRPFRADDGLIVRARVPGGRVGLAALGELMSIGRDHGTPLVQLTSRANLQVRGLPDPLPADVTPRLQRAGLLPSLSHERARNVLASPLEPRVWPLVQELDRRLCEDPVLAALPGRFLFCLTGSDGLLLGEPIDVAYQLLTPDAGLLLAGGRGRPCPPSDAVGAMLGLAHGFLADRTDERVWNVRDLPAESPVFDGLAPLSPITRAPLSVGPTGPHLVAGVPLGLLTEAHLAALAEVCREVAITPWRSVVIPSGAGAAAYLSQAGLVTSPDNAWAQLSACPGSPHCGRSASDTMGLASQVAAQIGEGLPRVHLVGCERSCGRPQVDHVLVMEPQSIADIAAAVGSRP
ncbi:MAG: cobalamin biosynthesis protein CobG [Micrococcales bacterium]|nr:cobalamin biosynthesis protein CobG [Micrococcales bacterium]